MGPTDRFRSQSRRTKRRRPPRPYRTGPLAPCRVRCRTVDHGQQRAEAVTRRSLKPQVASLTALWSGMEETGDKEFESPHPAAASPLGSCRRGSGRRGRPSPSGPHWEPLPARCGRHRPHRPCRPPAISSGRERSPAVRTRSLGGGRGAGRPCLTWGNAAARNCMACKGSSSVGVGSTSSSLTTGRPVPWVGMIRTPLWLHGFNFRQPVPPAVQQKSASRSDLVAGSSTDCRKQRYLMQCRRLWELRRSAQR